MQRFEILTKTQVEGIHETSLRILDQIGLDFGYPPALEVLKKGGAKVDGQRVFFPSRRPPIRGGGPRDGSPPPAGTD